MNLSAWLYVVDIISNIGCILSTSFIVFILLLIIAAIITLGFWNDESARYGVKKCWKLLYKKLLWIVFILVFLLIIIPSSKTMYLMLGTSYLSSTNIPKKVQEALELKIDDVIDDLRKPRKANEVKQ